MTMKAAFYESHGLPRDVVRVGHVPVPPSPGRGQVLVKVHAASLNPADWKSAGGSHKSLLRFAWPRVYGFDFSGVIAQVGEGVGEGGRPGARNVGDEVFGMIAGIPQRDRGTLAEYVIVEADICAARPASASHAECAAMPLVCITAVKVRLPCAAYCASWWRARAKWVRRAGSCSQLGDARVSAHIRHCCFRPCSTRWLKMLRACRPAFDSHRGGPRVLVTGGSGGVGTVAIQLARLLFNASYIVATASAGAKSELCRSLGADRVIDYRGEAFEHVLASTDPEELFDMVLDCVGDASRCVSLLRHGGGMCSIAAGQTTESLRTWMKESHVDPSTMTFGVRGFLTSGIGGWLFPQFTGGARLARACEARGASFAHVIGTGNGDIMAEIAELMEEGKLRAVIDSEFPLDKSLDAIEKQREGHAAGKVVVSVIST